MTDIYAWQSAVWERVIAQKARLHHAMLLHGRRGMGKLDFALSLSKALLCAQPNHGAACGQCAKCLWFDEGAHPDFIHVAPENNDEGDEAAKKKSIKKQISIDQIRRLIAILALSNHDAGALRVVLIHPAELMNVASANALLKVLEEPPVNTIFLLVSHQIQRLLPTVVSRCQVVDMPIPTRAQAIDFLHSSQIAAPEVWLDYMGGAPISVLESQIDMIETQKLIQQLALGPRMDALSQASLFVERGMEYGINILQKWLFDLLLNHYKVQARYHTQQALALQALAKSVNLKLLLSFQKTLLQAKITANHPLSQELQMEHLLLQYKKIFNS